MTPSAIRQSPDVSPFQRTSAAVLDPNMAIDQAAATSRVPEFANDITRFIERNARWLFLAIGLLYLVSFNGQWRIGMDSANYRGLADSIASGRGYAFGDWAPYNVYPGLPLLLAVCQKIVGSSSALLPCLVMLSMSVTLLRLTYLLIRLHFPKWIAIAVTFMLGTNACYLQQTSELMTDVPFALGLVFAIYGWEKLRLTMRDPAVVRRSRAVAISITQLLVGLALAASMRPTFLVLVAAWGITCAIGLVTGPQRKFFAVALVTMLAVWSAFVAVDPRSHGFHPLSGGYEREATELISNTSGASEDKFIDKLLYVLNDQLPAGFFGEQLSLGSIRVNGKKYSPTSILGSLIVIAAPLLLLRRYPLWAFLAWLTVVVTILYAAEPRYYLMAMPVLIIAWISLVVVLARRLPGHWSNVALAAGLLLVTLNNISASVAFVHEQRAFNFIEKYRKGKWLAAVRMAEIIRQKVQPNESVIAPSGSVMSYLSGRHVYTQRELFKPHAKVVDFPRIIAEKNIRYAIFPAPLYRDKEPAMSRLMLHGVLRPMHRVADLRGLRLETLHVTVPPGDWQHLPRLAGASARYLKPAPRSAALIAKAAKAAKIVKAKKAAKAAKLKRRAPTTATAGSSPLSTVFLSLTDMLTLEPLSDQTKRSGNPVAFRYTEGQTEARTEIRDPCIVRDGDRYHLVFTMWPFRNREEAHLKEPNQGGSPGIAMYGSSDLKIWTFENWLVKASNLPDNCPYKNRFWAPEIHKIKGKYYLILQQTIGSRANSTRRVIGDRRAIHLSALPTRSTVHMNTSRTSMAARAI